MEIVQNWMTLFPNDFTYTFLKIETIALQVEEMFNHFTMFVIDSTSTLFQACMHGCAGLLLYGDNFNNRGRGYPKSWDHPMVSSRKSNSNPLRLSWRRGNRERINQTFLVFNTSSLETSIGLMDLVRKRQETCVAYLTRKIYFVKFIF